MKNENKRSVTLGRVPNRHVTSVNVSKRDWDQLQVIAASHNLKRNRLIEIIDKDRRARELGNLSEVLRKFVNDHSANPTDAAVWEFASDQSARTAATA